MKKFSELVVGDKLYIFFGTIIEKNINKRVKIAIQYFKKNC